MKRYDKLPAKPAERERDVLAFWREQEVFRRTLDQTRGGPRYVFYEGPPTANGRPHLGHLIPRVYKDVFPRYKTMRGFYVERKGGWDTHGLPVELEVEKAIGVNSKSEIEAYGVERFVLRCKESVWKYKADWERMMERMGFWIDLENAYVTYTNEYIETVWWELRQMYDRGLLYQGHKVLPYCPRCGTGLSSHEVAQGYRTTEDPSVTIRMPLREGGDASYRPEVPKRTALLVWTTTPWTLPANLAVVVAAGEPYVEVDTGSERLIVAKARLRETLPGEPRVLRELLGADLVGLCYEPPYRLVADPKVYRVYPADFVTMSEGTGLVHTAPAFGEDDYRLGQAEGLPFFHPVDLTGRFTGDFPLAEGVFVKEADSAILDDLRRRGVLFRSATHTHEYPFCWRCDTPLLYYAMDSWYLRTTAVKDELVANNDQVRWYPEHVGKGRLGDFLANLKDWALSRDRYWGTPLNIWVCEACSGRICVGSRDELVAAALDPSLAASVELHRPYVDQVVLRCPSCGGTAQRVPNVIDAWFDSGSMHTAQWHYPFENRQRFAESFPADFICEGMEQTRGWFYTLLATGTILHGGPAYRTCIATGLGLDENGLKMSKSRGNVIDPEPLIDAYGADSLRWSLCSSSAPWTSKRLGEADVKEPLYRFLDTLRNTYDFFALYASIDGYDAEQHEIEREAEGLLDRWILSRLASTIRDVTRSLDDYDAMAATGRLEALLDDLSNWYVRLSRRRFWRGGLGRDKAAAYATLRTVLLGLARLSCPFIPFLSEEIYRRLRKASDRESVHLARWPDADEARIDADLEAEMALARDLASVGREARQRSQIKVRQPLARALVQVPQGAPPISRDVLALVESELNVESVEILLGSPDVESPWMVAVPNFRTLGPKLGPRAGEVAEWIKAQPAASLRTELARGSLRAELGGGSVTLSPEDVLFRTEIPPWMTLSERGGTRVFLDTRLDAALRERGLVRELVHRIQNLRKEAGFDVTDRICLHYEGHPALEDLLARHAQVVAEEVLAVEIQPGRPPAGFVADVEVDEGRVSFGLSRVTGR